MRAHACITLPIRFPIHTASCAPATSPAIWAWATWWSGGPDGTARRVCCSFICEIPMATGWNCSVTTIYSSISRLSLWLGMCENPAWRYRIDQKIGDNSDDNTDIDQQRPAQRRGQSRPGLRWPRIAGRVWLFRHRRDDCHHVWAGRRGYRFYGEQLLLRVP